MIAHLHHKQHAKAILVLYVIVSAHLLFASPDQPTKFIQDQNAHINILFMCIYGYMYCSDVHSCLLLIINVLSHMRMCVMT